MKKTLIQHKTVTDAGGSASIQFTAIPQTYTDLYLVVSARNTTTNDECWVYPNGSTSNLSYRLLRSSGSGVVTGTAGRFYMSISSDTANTFGTGECYITNYTTSAAKMMTQTSASENNATTAYMGIQAVLWNDTTAISSLEIKFTSGNLAQYSSASLYGISKYNTSAAPKASGGIISYDSVNDKWVHVFTASGTFTPSENLTAEYVVIAGGGGAAQTRSAGGGAGGYRSSVAGESSGGGASAESALSLTASTGYTVTVGAGGTGGTGGYAALGTSGSASSLSTVSTVGGGRGGQDGVNATGADGGSGGGGTPSSGNKAGGAGTAGEGYAGGTGIDSAPNYGAGGGGGAGSVGSNGSGSSGGNGGTGVTSSITGSAIARAGGGGGASLGGGVGVGVAGGGTATNNNNRGESGTPGTGGGGGGGGYTSNPGGEGGNGGSGIVIVRYSA